MEALLCCLVFSLILPLSQLGAHTSYMKWISPYSLEFLKQRVQGQDLDPQLTHLPLFIGYRQLSGPQMNCQQFLPVREEHSKSPWPYQVVLGCVLRPTMLPVHKVREIQCPMQSSEIPPAQLTLCARHGLERGHLMGPRSCTQWIPNQKAIDPSVGYLLLSPQGCRRAHT